MLEALTADYRAAGFDLLERLAVMTPEDVARFSAGRRGVAGAVVLATCNRFEAYVDVADADPVAAEAALADLVGFVAEATGADPGAVAEVLVRRSGADIAGHLFAVSSGLESLVVGEAQIAGQVSRALETARTAGTTTPDLERLFQRASRTSSAVQHRTRLGAAGRSIVRLALDLVGSRVTDWTAERVLLIGTGSYAGATLAELRSRGVAAVAVYSPSGRAERFAMREGVAAVPRAELAARLGSADLVISCSIATTPILSSEQLLRARAATTPPVRQIVVDLGLPRNIAPDVAAVPGVELLDLETISLHAPLPELHATDEARALVEHAVEEYRADQRATAATPAVVALRAHVFELVEAELDRLRKRGEATETVERAMRHLAGVLVHTPSARARDLAARGEADRFADAVATVFGVDATRLRDAAPLDAVVGIAQEPPRSP